jgi:hypothetical protein
MAKSPDALPVCVSFAQSAKLAGHVLVQAGRFGHFAFAIVLPRDIAQNLGHVLAACGRASSIVVQELLHSRLGGGVVIQRDTAQDDPPLGEHRAVLLGPVVHDVLIHRAGLGLLIELATGPGRLAQGFGGHNACLVVGKF